MYLLLYISALIIVGLCSLPLYVHVHVHVHVYNLQGLSCDLKTHTALGYTLCCMSLLTTPLVPINHMLNSKHTFSAA